MNFGRPPAKALPPRKTSPWLGYTSADDKGMAWPFLAVTPTPRALVCPGGRLLRDGLWGLQQLPRGWDQC